MVNRLLIVKWIYLSVLLIGCHGSIADEEERTDLPQSNHGAPASEGAMQEEADNIASGNFQLVRGKQYALCRDFLRNLELYVDEQPMICDRKYHPSLTKFQKPEWEEVDPQEYRHLLKQMFLMYTSGSQGAYKLNRDIREKQWSDYIRGNKDDWEAIPLEERLGKGWLRIWRGNLDVANEGVRRNVLKVSFRKGCEYKETMKYYQYSIKAQPMYSYYVMDDKDEIDSGYWYSANGLFAGDLLFYDGTTYHIRWQDYSGIPNTPLWEQGGLVIRKPSATNLSHTVNFIGTLAWPGELICSFEYVPGVVMEDATK